jgi:hypothetical protein
MGTHGDVDSKLSAIQSRSEVLMYVDSSQRLSITESNIVGRESSRDLEYVAQAMDRQLRATLLSAVTFFLAVLTFAAYSIYSSVFVTNSYTIKYVFYSLATGCLLIICVLLLRWNSRS